MPKSIELTCLTDLGFMDEIPETGTTLEANAREKAIFVHRKFNVNCFAEDTGLEVPSLNGEPGVYSARYAGQNKSSEENIALLLENLRTRSDRSARFRTVISLFLDGIEHQFSGEVGGRISEKISGNGGFGYDPVFIPEGFSKSFAELSVEEKNTISHRGKAMRKLIDFLNEIG